ncbi:MAG: hypothetical protein RML14_00005 [Meiothermus sp.]|uniref:hypothetical protein n=1 Tax=Meiothermus sp. TaxID=1955249 RepID=UPI00298EFE30|nr:hypothetical protein [Meiothermus sp.]MDW8480305.1 hypothetical protein [Meiothermus sp.]
MRAAPLSPHGMRHTHATLLAQKTKSRLSWSPAAWATPGPASPWTSTGTSLGWELEEVALPLNELLAPAPRTLH